MIVKTGFPPSHMTAQLGGVVGHFLKFFEAFIKMKRLFLTALDTILSVFKVYSQINVKLYYPPGLCSVLDTQTNNEENLQICKLQPGVQKILYHFRGIRLTKK